MNKVLTVVFPTDTETGFIPTKGTKVLMPDGTELPALKHVSVGCDVDGLIEVTIKAFARISFATPQESGGKDDSTCHDVTTLSSGYREHFIAKHD